MRARSEHRGFGLGQTDDSEEIGGVGHSLLEVPQQPGEALDGDKAGVLVAGEIQLPAQFLRVVEIRPEGAVGVAFRILAEAGA